MTNDEYHIPHHMREPEHSVESDIRAQLDAIQYSPEKQPALYQHIKDLEEMIFAKRESQVGIVKKPKGWLKGLVFTPQSQTLRDIIDHESRIGGAATFGEGHRFWLDAKATDTPYTNNVADWYHVGPVEHPAVLRFQTTPEQIHKLYEGRDYQPSQQEIDTFVAAVEAYANAVLADTTENHNDYRLAA